MSWFFLRLFLVLGVGEGFLVGFAFGKYRWHDHSTDQLVICIAYGLLAACWFAGARFRGRDLYQEASSWEMV
jgi:hypothetical protein